jgi:hypothetical protein
MKRVAGHRWAECCCVSGAHRLEVSTWVGPRWREARYMYLHVTVHSSPRSWTRLCRTHLLVKTSVSGYHCTVFFVYCVRSSFRVCRWTCEVDKKTFVRAVNRRWFPGRMKEDGFQEWNPDASSLLAAIAGMGCLHQLQTTGIDAPLAVSPRMTRHFSSLKATNRLAVRGQARSRRQVLSTHQYGPGIQAGATPVTQRNTRGDDGATAQTEATCFFFYKHMHCFILRFMKSVVRMYR